MLRMARSRTPLFNFTPVYAAVFLFWCFSDGSIANVDEHWLISSLFITQGLNAVDGGMVAAVRLPFSLNRTCQNKSKSATCNGGEKCQVVMLITIIYRYQAADCSPRQIHQPSIPGIEVVASMVFPVFDMEIDGLQVNPIKHRRVSVTFCNVSLTYTHPGWDDSINIKVWLPLSGWNKRLQGIGGDDFAGTRGDGATALAVAGGYAAVSSDLGHDAFAPSAREWALDDESGHVNVARLLDFSSVALSEMAILGKDIVQQFYGEVPKRSYWNGCAGGGRQGMMLAQRFPDAFDGILAGSPSLSWAHSMPASYWSNFAMRVLNTYPSPCVMNAIAAEVIKACDDRDGVVDGIITEPELCDFNVLFLVGKHVDCGDGVDVEITLDVVTLAQKMWQGMRDQYGVPLWHGFSRGSLWHGTECSSSEAVHSHNCSPTLWRVVIDWLSLFLAQDPDLDLYQLKVTYPEFIGLFRLSVAGYQSIISADSPDLHEFKKHGGKIIHWHGLNDEKVAPGGSKAYYAAVAERDPAVMDFYRYFEAPGVGHCGSGPGPAPSAMMAALTAWVEMGIAPDSLPAVSEGGSLSRIVCPYPLVVTYLGGDPDKPEAFGCWGSMGVPSDETSWPLYGEWSWDDVETVIWG